MTFYIASSFRNVEAVRTLATSLQKLGYTQTYDWTQHQRASEAQELKTIGELEKQAVERARFFYPTVTCRKRKPCGIRACSCNK